MPVAMRAIIRHGQSRRGGEEAFVPNGNGLLSNAANGNSGGLVRQQNGGGRAIKTEESDKGGGGGGGGGGIEVKTEPMEFEFSGRNTLPVRPCSPLPTGCQAQKLQLDLQKHKKLQWTLTKCPMNHT